MVNTASGIVTVSKWPFLCTSWKRTAVQLVEVFLFLSVRFKVFFAILIITLMFFQNVTQNCLRL